MKIFMPQNNHAFLCCLRKNEDDSILRYNYAVALISCGKLRESFEVLLALWKDKKNHGDLPIIKARLLLLVKKQNEKYLLRHKNCVHMGGS